MRLSLSSGPTLASSPRTAEKRALLLSFAVFGSFWGSLAALLPDVRAQVGVDDGQLGLALGAIALSALPVMPLAGRLMDRSGASTLLPLSLLAFGLATPLLGFATSLPVLVLAFVALGATTGTFDVASTPRPRPGSGSSGTGSWPQATGASRWACWSAAS